MISLTRLSGTAFLLNADLIERVDCTPDTVVTLVDGTKYVVGEPLIEVLDSVLAYRAAIVARASMPDAAGAPLRSLDPGTAPVHPPAVRLSAVPVDRPSPSDRQPDRNRGGNQ